MADENDETNVQLLQALVGVINEYTAPEAQQLRLLILRRLALSGDVIPSRLPAPKNITEVGGYLNLLDSLGAPELKLEAVASILGIASPSIARALPSEPPLFLVSRPNHRPARAQEAIPLELRVRSDFAAALDGARRTIAEHGAALPLLSGPIALPPALGTTPPPGDLLPFIGRALDVVPAAALVDPDLDPVAVARLTGEAAGAERLAALVLDPLAPSADTVAIQDWAAWALDPATEEYVERVGPRALLEVMPLLNAAGWYRLGGIDTTALEEPASWARLVNVTGLVAGVTTYGDELRLLYRAEQIAASSLAACSSHTWDGTAFVE